MTESSLHPGLLTASMRRTWESVATLLAHAIGPNCETVLHDFADPMHSVVFVVNGSVTNRVPGQGFRHLVAEMLRAEAEQKGTDLLPDWWFRYQEDAGHAEKIIRSMTQLIRNDAGEMVGALCINIDVTADAHAFERMRALLPGLAGVELPTADRSGIFPTTIVETKRTAAHTTEHAESTSNVPDTVFGLIDRIAAEADANATPNDRTPSGALSREARRRLIAYMEERGLFLVKGAKERVADALKVSRVTIYSDLDHVRNQWKAK